MENSQGNPAPQAGQGQAAPEAAQGNPTPQGGTTSPIFTQEQLAQINRIFTERSRASAKKIDDDITSRLAAFETNIQELLTPISDSLSRLTEQRQQSPQPPQQLGEQARPDSAVQQRQPQQQDPADSPAFRKITKELQEVKAKLEASEAEKAATRKQLRDKELRATLGSALKANGIAAVEHAVGYLIDSTKRVRYEGDDSSEIVFVNDDGDVEELRTGVPAWAKSEAAKIYMPPSGAAGSGDHGGGRPPVRPQQSGVPTLAQALGPILRM